MKQYFLMGINAMLAFQKGGAEGLVSSGATYSIISFDPEHDNVTSVLNEAIGWDGFAEITPEEVEAIGQEAERFRLEVEADKRYWATMKQQIRDEAHAKYFGQF